MPLMRRAEYAEHRKSLGLPGGTAVAVGYAIKDGRIRCDPETHTIDSEQADIDWAANTNPLLSAAGAKAGPLTERSLNAQARRDGIDRIPRATPRHLVCAPMRVPADVKGDFATSRTNKEFYDSEMARIKFEERNGQLIQANLVQKVLYETARVVRAGHEDIVAQLAPGLASETMISRVEILLKTALDRLDTSMANTIAGLEDLFKEEVA